MAKQKQRCLEWQRSKTEDLKAMRKSTWMLRHFLNLVSDLNVTDLAWLYDYETLRTSVYMFDFESSAVRHPETLSHHLDPFKVPQKAQMD